MELKLGMKDDGSSANQNNLKTPSKSHKLRDLGASPVKNENLGSNPDEPISTDRGLLNSAANSAA